MQLFLIVNTLLLLLLATSLTTKTMFNLLLKYVCVVVALWSGVLTLVSFGYLIQL